MHLLEVFIFSLICSFKFFLDKCLSAMIFRVFENFIIANGAEASFTFVNSRVDKISASCVATKLKSGL